MAIQKIQELQISSFPPFQKQRWSSAYKTLKYILNNIGSLSCLFDEEELEFLNVFDMATLLNEIEPINDFTVKCESDNFT